MKWRRLNFALHRDIGYFCIGLTLIYGLSGLVVNHISHDFNPDYQIEQLESHVEPSPVGKQPDIATVKRILAQLNETGTIKNVVMLSPTKMRIFIEGNTIDVWMTTGKVVQEKLNKRPVVFEANFLHLNKAKGVWTFIADGYALMLILLAVTGFLMIRRRTAVRGVFLTVAGLLLPIIMLIIVFK